MTTRILHKVTAVVTRNYLGNTQLLIFRHPYAGYQLPAGTVEAGESPGEAVVREVLEETGLHYREETHYLGSLLETFEGYAILLEKSPVFARPDPTSFNWANLPRGCKVQTIRYAPGYTQVSYQEPDSLPEPEYMTYQITGWVAEHALASAQERHIFHLAASESSQLPARTFTDQHHFEPQWVDVRSLPALIKPQDRWLAFARSRLDWLKDKE